MEKTRNGKKDIFPLKLVSDTKIIRHNKIVGEANPFDPDWKPYFEERMTYKMLLSLKGRSSLLYMWKKQNHRCPICGEVITTDTQWNVREKEESGKLIRLLVHDSCYRHNR